MHIQRYEIWYVTRAGMAVCTWTDVSPKPMAITPSTMFVLPPESSQIETD